MMSSHLIYLAIGIRANSFTFNEKDFTKEFLLSLTVLAKRERLYQRVQITKGHLLGKRMWVSKKMVQVWLTLPMKPKAEVLRENVISTTSSSTISFREERQ